MGVVRYLHDRLQNAITGTGTARDPRTASGYAIMPPLSDVEIAAAYRGSGLMRKICNIPAMDMVREWREWQADKPQIEALEAEENRLGLRRKVYLAERLRALGGGAFILGLPGNPSEPAPAVGKGGLAYINLVSRWQVSFNDLNDDATSDRFGEPLMWQMQTTASGQVSIHPSRVIPFRADPMPPIAMSASMHDEFWGESVVAQVLDAVKDSDTARASFAALLHKARLLRIGIPGLMEIASTTEGERLIMSRLATLAMGESVHNATIYDSGSGDMNPGEKIDDVSYNFAGAKDVIAAYNDFVCAVADTPATRLLGRAPDGMNSSGDSQQKDWNKKVRAKQELELRPCLDRLDAFMIPSALGSRPPEIWWQFGELDDADETAEATRFKTTVEALTGVQAMASVPEIAFNKAAQNTLVEGGWMPGLDAALNKVPEAERFGIEQEGGDPVDLAGAGGDELEAEPPVRAADAAPRTLYVQRKLLNAAEFIAWAKSQGFTSTLPADELHVTVAFSRQAVDWMAVEPSWDGDKGELTVPAGGARLVEPLGDKGAVVLLFNSSTLAYRHEAIIRAGASWDYPEYQPHVSITYAGADVDLSKVEPFRGQLHFGPEIFSELDEGWADKIEEA